MADHPIPRSDQDIYSFTLRVAVLHDQSLLSSTTTTTPTPTPPTPPPLKHLSSFRPSDGWTKSLFSLNDLFKDPASKDGSSVKFPPKFIPIFDQKLLSLIHSRPRTQAEAEDELQESVLFNQTLSEFYKKFKEDSFQRRLNKNRQTEELILTFGTHASLVLKRELQGEEWKLWLDLMVGLFIKLVRDCLRVKELKKSVPQELLVRLDAHCSKLSSPPPPLLPTTSTPIKDPLPPPSIPGLTTNISSMPFVKAVGQLFGKNHHDLTKDVISLKRLCSERSAYSDLKHLINNVAQSSRYPTGSPTEFTSEEAFQAWKKVESSTLSELLFELISKNPGLTLGHSIIGEGSGAGGGGGERNSWSGGGGGGESLYPTPEGSIISSNSGGEEDLSDLTTTSSLIFIPPDPKFYYRRLFEIALDHDYDLLSTLPPDEYVSLNILSELNEKLLKEVQVRWRIGDEVRIGVWLGIVVGWFRGSGVPEACVEEGVRELEEILKMVPGWRWRVDDQKRMTKTLSTLFDILLTRFWEIFEGRLLSPYSPILSLLSRIQQSSFFDQTIKGERISELEIGMKKWVEFAYEEKMTDFDSEQRGNDLEPFLKVLVWIEGEIKGYERVFAEGLVCGIIDVPALFVSVAAPEFVKHLDASKKALLEAASQAPGAATDEDILALYRGVIQLQQIHKAYCPEEPLQIDFSAWFEPYVRRWLITTDTKTVEWVKRAIASDWFKPEDGTEDGHSCSVVDLIASCKSATEFILRLEWPNQFENAKYLTAVSQTIAKSIEQYSNLLEGLFMEEMFPRKILEDYDADANRPSAWLTKAKLAVQGDKRVEPFIFKAESLVKLNNIQAARKLLDRMYTTLDADNVAKIIETHTASNPPPVPSKQSQLPPRFLFTVKIVLSENLYSLDSGQSRKKLDPFCILSDPSGHRVAKTRTLYETSDPRWDETFDVSVKGDLWIRATLYHRNLVEDHDIIGRAYIHLDPNDFQDFLPRDVWLQLEGTNEQKLESRLLLRISMEGEKDDIRFYFGRAFRSLKRAENDMTRTIVDKMSPFVRHYISQPVLRALVKTQFNFDIDLDRVRDDFSKATGKINALVRDALNTREQQLIPDVESHRNPGPQVPQKPGEKKKGRGPLTDEEIEDAIGPLFDYFNVTFAVLSATLSPDAWELVSSRLWKDILTTIEGLIVPPLSHKPTEMKLLSEKEIEIVFKWLRFLVDFFHLGGEGLPLSSLRNAKYQELVMAQMYYDWSPDALCEEAVRSMQRQLSKTNSILGRRKSVYNQRNLGTIKAHKIEKQQAETSSSDIILRILRMHPGQSDFIAQQIQTIAVARAPRTTERPGSLQRRTPAERGNRLSGLGRGRGRPGVPALPSIPDAYQNNY